MFLKWILSILIVLILTIFTQIGGIIFLVAAFTFKTSFIKRITFFVAVYLLSTYLIVPFLAPFFGREKIKTTATIKVHTWLTTISNRNYVRPEVNEVLIEVSKELAQMYPNIEIRCLDANFPFINKFPLLPHLSHNDGKKLDISLLYKNEKGEVTNEKPSRSGYGVFTGPLGDEYDQIEVCKDKGYWQYDFPKYLTLGRTNPYLVLSEEATSKMITYILKNKRVSKVFIEPHLRDRMKLSHPKLRYHGCRAVRHDDHIHLQVN